ncbi:DUF5672 family protein [uncultured Empedobacter sp.]|uniref:DUF5672 family protein n=1 Tax=uncultured Empedobacter sp. TaxID=410844 RepID=UPI00260928C3|nr:DUF5672 family protein [uncultured Empedobacter sp.]
MNNLKKVAVVIPIYRDFLDEFEKKSLESILRHFNDFEIIFAAPEGMTISSYSPYLNRINHYSFIYFGSDCFKSIDAYNQLLLDEKFYQVFTAFEFILICQLDVYVFKNILIEWCNKNYDYVGAPWIGSERNFINLTFEKINEIIRSLKGKKLKNTERLFKVGNGGFSLRKVQKFVEISKEESKQIHLFLDTKSDSDYHIEDVFWSLYVPKKYPNFKIPNWKEALDFCMDRKPKKAMKLNIGRLPMACHRFNQPIPYQFWKKFIE